jgi:hypothetical protein
MQLREKLIKAIKESWGPDTVYNDPDLDLNKEAFEENPARGQCVISSLVVQDYLGGEIVTWTATPHYWNKLEDGTIIDVSGEQFGKNYKPPEHSWSTHRTQLLAYNEQRQKRYTLLKSRVDGIMRQAP